MLSDDEQRLIRNALLESYFVGVPKDHQETDIYRTHIHDHVIGRFEYFTKTILPWITRRVNMTKMKAIEIGSGTGSWAAAVAPVVESLHCYEIDIKSTIVAKARLDAMSLAGNVTFHNELFNRDSNIVKNHESCGALFLIASLEHMTFDECVEILQIGWEILEPGGIIVVADTPNRLSPFDHHTSWLPFFDWLPDEVKLAWVVHSPREDLKRDLSQAKDKKESLVKEVLVRAGRGISYHEFEIALGEKIHENILANGYEPDFLNNFGISSEEEIILQTFELLNVKANIGFCRPSLNLIIGKPPDRVNNDPMSCIFDQLVEIVAADQKMRLQEITNNRLHQPAKPDYQSIERELECERKNSEALNARLRAFETSTSWRVTAGVRAIAKALAALGVRR